MAEFELQAGDLCRWITAKGERLVWLLPTADTEAWLVASATVDDQGRTDPELTVPLGRHQRPHSSELVLNARPRDPAPGHPFPRFGDGGVGSSLFAGPHDGRWIGWKPGCGRWIGLVEYAGPHHHPALPPRTFCAEWPLALLLWQGAVTLEYFD